MSAVLVRRVRLEDAVQFKAIRLAALADTPSAFGRTHAEESAYLPSQWIDAVVERSSGDMNATFLAFADDDTVGLVGGYRPDPGDVVMELVSMWVDPGHRGRRVADRLVAEVIDFAISVGCEAVELWVTVGNDRARVFYERMGFEALDDFAPLPSDPCKNEQRMRRNL